MIGVGENASTVYIIDYGLIKRYRDAKTQVHISFRDHKKLTGTTRYASVNTHRGGEQSRRDDMECVAYTLIYLLRGELPWQGLPARNKAEKNEKIVKIKADTPIEVLCKGIPLEFGKYLNYCKSLKFEERPDYNQSKKLFRDLFYRSKFDHQFEFDWIKLKIDISIPADKDWSSNDSNQAENPEKAAENPHLDVPHQEETDSPRITISQKSVSQSYLNKPDNSPSNRNVLAVDPSKDYQILCTSATKLPDLSAISTCKDVMNVTVKPEEDKPSTSDDQLCNFPSEDLIEDHSIYGKTECLVG